MIETTAEELWVERSIEAVGPRIYLGPPPWEGLAGIWWQMLMEGRETQELAAFSVETWALDQCILVDEERS